MNVKRTSYFSFLVAISTIATVSCVHAAQLNSDYTKRGELTTISSCEVQQQITLECWMALAKALEEKGLPASQCKITSFQQTDGSEQYLICLEVDKNYKGSVAALIGAGTSSEVLLVHQLITSDGLTVSNSPPSDLRSSIKQKSRILRE